MGPRFVRCPEQPTHTALSFQFCLTAFAGLGCVCRPEPGVGESGTHGWSLSLGGPNSVKAQQVQLCFPAPLPAFAPQATGRDASYLCRYLPRTWLAALRRGLTARGIFTVRKGQPCGEGPRALCRAGARVQHWRLARHHSTPVFMTDFKQFLGCRQPPTERQLRAPPS